MNNLRDWIFKSESNSLKNVRNRKAFSSRLCERINYWNINEMQSFVDEMRGLDFYRSEDRAIFCDFLFSWLKERSYEGFNS